jgi:hypothetical protein
LENTRRRQENEAFIMPRKKMARGLSPLPARVTFKAKKHKGAQLLEILRGIAMANQQEEPQVFYPIREVARHLDVPVSTVSRVYDALEEEGILVSVRGSKTLLQGLSGGRHLSVLGFIGMPALISSFVTLQDCRTFFIRTRREQWNAPSAGTYFISIKFSGSSLGGEPAPSPGTTVHYDFMTTGVPGSTSGLDLILN